MQRAGAGQGDQLFGKRANFLGLGQGGADLAVLDEALHQAAAQRFAMLGVAAQLPAADQVTAHCYSQIAFQKCPLSVVRCQLQRTTDN